MNTMLRNTILGGLLIIPFLSFFVSESMLFPFISGKNFAFRILVEIIFVLWVILGLRDKDYLPKRSWILYSFLGLIAFLGLVDFLGMNPDKSFWSNFERMEGFIAHLHLFLYFLVLSSVAFAKKTWDWVLGIWIAVGGVMSIYGLTELKDGIGRIDGTFGNPIYLAVFLLFTIFFTLFFLVRFIRENKKGMLLTLSLLLVLQLVVLYYSATRGAILGLLGGLVITASLIAWKERESKAVRRVAIGGLTALFLIVAGFFAVKDAGFVKESPVLSRFSSLSLSEIKTQGRYFIWPMAWEGIKEKPLLGWGQENFNYVFNANYDPGMYAQEQWFDRAHNAPLDWLIAGGFLTFVPYLALFVLALWYLWKKEGFGLSPAERGVLTGLFAAYFFQSLFVFDNLFSYILFVTILAYAESQSEGARIGLPKWMTEGSMRSAFSILLVLGLCFTVYTWNMKPIKAGQDLIGALRALGGGEHARALDRFESVFASGTFAVREGSEQLSSVAPLFLGEGVSQENRERYLTLARRELEARIAADPLDARPHIFYGNFLRSAGLFDAALAEYEQALVLSPDKQSFLLEIGGMYIAKGDYEKAYEYFKKAYELEPAFEDAKMILGIGALYKGEKAEAEALWSEVGREKLIFDDRVASALADRGELTLLINFFAARLEYEKGKEDIQNFINLAIAYQEAGNRAEAIRVLRSAAEAFPEHKADIEAYIGGL